MLDARTSGRPWRAACAPVARNSSSPPSRRSTGGHIGIGLHRPVLRFRPRLANVHGPRCPAPSSRTGRRHFTPELFAAHLPPPWASRSTAGYKRGAGEPGVRGRLFDTAGGDPQVRRCRRVLAHQRVGLRVVVNEASQAWRRHRPRARRTPILRRLPRSASTAPWSPWRGRRLQCAAATRAAIGVTRPRARCASISAASG